jgi:Peptidase family M23
MQRNSGQPVSGTRTFARVRVITLTFLVVFISPAPAAAAWRLPVSGPVSRVFSVGANPYAGGHHRGVDLAAPPGARVRAPCAGRVLVAGRVGSSGGVVTVLCGDWRATLLPLSTISARRGGSVSAGTFVGTLARSPDHAGVHLGVRRDGVRFGYVDPLRFLAPSRPGAPVPLGRAPRGRPRAPLGAPVAAPLAAPTTPPLGAPLTPLRAPAPRPLRHLAPWPAWVGLALALAGLGIRWRWHRSHELRLRGAAVESAGG